jgi:hypothetical protein
MIKIDDWGVWKVLMMLVSFLKMNLNRKIEKIEKLKKKNVDWDDIKYRKENMIF